MLLYVVDTFDNQKLISAATDVNQQGFGKAGYGGQLPPPLKFETCWQFDDVNLGEALTSFVTDCTSSGTGTFRKYFQDLA